MGLGGAKRSRSPSDASPGAFCLLCRHGQSRSPPALRPQARFGAQPPRQRRLLARRWRRNSPCGKRTNPNPVPSSAPVCALGHLPPRGKAFGRPHGAAPTEKGKAFGRPSVPPLRRKGRFSGGEDTAPTEKKKALEHIGRPFRGTKMGGFSNPACGLCSPCA